MDYNFRCCECNNLFTAENVNNVTCPHCGSDNVTPVSTSSAFMKYFLIGFLFVLMAAGGFFIVQSLQNERRPKPDYDDFVQVTEHEKEDIVVNHIIEEKEPEVALEPLKIEPIKPQLSNGTYFFEALCVNADEKDNLFWALCESVGEQDTVVTSTDGKFSQIKHSENGTYVLKVRSAKGAKGELAIAGFNKPQVQKVSQMSAQTLENMINNRKENELNNSNQLAYTYKLRIVDGQSGDESIKTCQNAIHQLKFNIWERVVILKVDYNETGQINYIEMKPVYSEEDF